MTTCINVTKAIVNFPHMYIYGYIKKLSRFFGTAVVVIFLINLCKLHCIKVLIVQRQFSKVVARY